MGNIDGLREQVEELKQRLNDPGSQKAADPSELKSRLASIKASLESKQGEIAQLAAEKERLAAEKQQVSAENDQLRKMLKEVLSAIDRQSADASFNILSEFLAETDPLIKPAFSRTKNVIAAGPPADQAAANPGKTEMAEADARDQAARPAGVAPKAADKEDPLQLGPETDDEGADEEDSPALRRIMKRSRRAG